MAVALTERFKRVFNDGNKKEVGYSVAFTGTYPSGGYTVNNAVYPSAANVFKKIHSVFIEGGQPNRNGYYFVVDPSEIDNSTSTNPYFKIRVFTISTGGAGVTELTTGATFVQTGYLKIEGIKAGGVDGDYT